MRKQNRVDGPSLKASIGIRLKTPTELMEEPKTAESEGAESKVSPRNLDQHPAEEDGTPADRNVISMVPSGKVPVSNATACHQFQTTDRQRSVDPGEVSRRIQRRRHSGRRLLTAARKEGTALGQ